MKFIVYPQDGGVPRTTVRIAFIDGQVEPVAQVLILTNEATIYSRDKRERIISTVDALAEAVAGLLHAHQNCSLVIYSSSSHSLRGNEANSADVYPPGVQPRIVVEG